MFSGAVWNLRFLSWLRRRRSDPPFKPQLFKVILNASRVSFRMDNRKEALQEGLGSRCHLKVLLIIQTKKIS